MSPSSLTKNRSATTTFLSIDSRVRNYVRNGVAPAETTDMTFIPLNIVGCSKRTWCPQPATTLPLVHTT